VGLDISTPNPYIISASSNEVIMRSFSSHEDSAILKKILVESKTTGNREEGNVRMEPIASLAISKTNRYLVAGTNNGSVYIYNFYTREQIKEFSVHKGIFRLT